jgi:hypothetical protein
MAAGYGCWLACAKVTLRRSAACANSYLSLACLSGSPSVLDFIVGKGRAVHNVCDCRERLQTRNEENAWEGTHRTTRVQMPVWRVVPSSLPGTNAA